MTANPSFTIVIPTFQRREVVCDAVRALGSLDYRGKIDVVVVVDGSTDGTVEALRKIDCGLPLRIDEVDNGGAARARNRGAAQASGEIILFLDDDMMCEPTVVEEHARMYRAGADAVIGDIVLDPASPPGFLSDSTGRWLDASRTTSPLSPFDVFTGQLSVRKAVFDALGGFDEAFTTSSSFSSEDSDLGVRLVAGYDVRHNPAAISRQRYVVSLRQFIDRAPAAAAGHLRFIRKHPRFRTELLQVIGRSRPLVRFVFLPLSLVPLVPKILSETAVLVGGIALKTPLRSNRAIARFVSGARIISYWSALRAGGGIPSSASLLVLGYHAIQDQSGDPVLADYGVPRKEFVRQLESLAARGFTFVGPDSLAAFIRQCTPLPRRAVLLTFDDCYSDLLGVAREVLRPRGIEAIAFAVTGTGSNTNEWDQRHGARTIQLLNPQELGELASMGIEIGSHSRSHRPMPLLDGCDQEIEAAGSAADLAASGLSAPRFFAHPYGARDEASMTAVRNAVYLAAFGPGQGRVGRECNPFELPRVIILAEDRGWRFRLKTHAPAAFRRVTDARDRTLAGLSKLRRLGRRAS